MRAVYVLHIAAGSLGLLLGYVALYATKGGPVHRRSGMLFVYAMLTMAAAGLTLAIVRNKAPDINVPAALITSYLIVTALTTVRPLADDSPWRRPLEIGGPLLALGVAGVMLAFGIQTLAAGGRRDGMPAFPFFLFASFGLLGAAGDLRVLRSGVRRGSARLARHLWRMSIALLIAALSFSVQLAMLLPKSFRPRWMLFIPILAVLVTMFYWLWRVRSRRPQPRIVLAQPMVVR